MIRQSIPCALQKINLLQYKTFTCTWRSADPRSDRRELEEPTVGAGGPMKISRALISALAVVLTSAQGAASRASAQAIAQPAERFGPPYPFTGAQIWAMLTAVIDLPDSEVTPTKIASILGAPLDTNLTSTQPVSDGISSYILHAPRDWYFNVNFYKTISTGAFQFSFNGGDLQDVVNGTHINLPQAMCITRETVVTTMKTRGWQTVGPPEAVPTGVTTAAPAPNSEAVVPPPLVVPLPPRDPELNFSLPPSRSAKVYFHGAGRCLMLLSVMQRGRS